MHYLYHLIEQYGLLIVFANVLAGQLGAPVPTYPTLVITGAFAYRGQYPLALLLPVAVVAALIADYIWFLAGRRFGRRVMSTLCRISLSPDSCVRQTESIYARWGARSLLLAKFIPGFASIASALAGSVGTSRTSFLIYDGIGAALWSGLAIFLGALLIVIALGIFIAYKWWQRLRFRKSLQMARISVGELNELLQSGQQPNIIDVRATDLQELGRIPGAKTITHRDIDSFDFDAPIDGEVVVYCACPNEASAAIVAKQLMRRGYRRVRPLTGGIDAWKAAGHAVEH